jgi:hypothetical protein
MPAEAEELRQQMLANDAVVEVRVTDAPGWKME